MAMLTCSIVAAPLAAVSLASFGQGTFPSSLA